MIMALRIFTRFYADVVCFPDKLGSALTLVKSDIGGNITVCSHETIFFLSVGVICLSSSAAPLPFLFY